MITKDGDKVASDEDEFGEDSDDGENADIIGEP